MAVALGGDKEESEEARYKREINEAIDKLPDHAAARIVLSELDCAVAFRTMHLGGRKTLKEVLTHKPAGVSDELIDVMLRVKALVEAYDAIEGYNKVMQAIAGEKKAEGALLKLVNPSLKLDKQAEDALLKSKSEGEEYLALLMHSPAEIMKLKDDVRKALRAER